MTVSAESALFAVGRQEMVMLHPQFENVFQSSA
jgi:hypothetical protein